MSDAIKKYLVGYDFYEHRLDELQLEIKVCTKKELDILLNDDLLGANFLTNPAQIKMFIEKPNSLFCDNTIAFILPLSSINGKGIKPKKKKVEQGIFYI